jgi:hypothetical protein
MMAMDAEKSSKRWISTSGIDIPIPEGGRADYQASTNYKSIWRTNYKSIWPKETNLSGTFSLSDRGRKWSCMGLSHPFLRYIGKMLLTSEMFIQVSCSGNIQFCY